MNKNGFASLIGMVILAFVMISLSYTTSKIQTKYIYDKLHHNLDEHIYQEVKKQIHNEISNEIIKESYQDCLITYEYGENEVIVSCSCFIEKMHLNYDLEKQKIFDVYFAAS